MRFATYFLLAIILLLAIQVNSALAKGTSCPELAMLMEKFLPTKTDGRLWWTVESENPDISWLAEGVHQTDNKFERFGTACIRAGGKEYYKLEARKTPVPWIITMKGDKFGVDSVTFAPSDEAWGVTASGTDIPFKEAMAINKNIRLQYIFENRIPGQAEIFYKIQAKGRSGAVLIYSTTEGSGGASGELTIDFTLPTRKKELEALKKRNLMVD